MPGILVERFVIRRLTDWITIGSTLLGTLGIIINGRGQGISRASFWNFIARDQTSGIKAIPKKMEV
jgi:F0F1-type ATP synthase membrane subunit c/vacuolar-type H+-ATPase subunit K